MRVGGGKRGLHDLHHTAHFCMSDQRLFFAVEGGAEIAVKVVHVALRTFDLIAVKGQLVAGGHGLGESCGGLDRENVVLTAAGIAAGILLGRWLHMWLVRSVEIDLMMFGRETDPMAYLWAALLTAGFSLLVNGFGYRKMRKIDMVESLKSAE